MALRKKISNPCQHLVSGPLKLSLTNGWYVKWYSYLAVVFSSIQSANAEHYACLWFNSFTLGICATEVRLENTRMFTATLFMQKIINNPNNQQKKNEWVNWNTLKYFTEKKNAVAPCNKTMVFTDSVEQKKPDSNGVHSVFIWDAKPSLSDGGQNTACLLRGDKRFRRWVAIRDLEGGRPLGFW